MNRSPQAIMEQSTSVPSSTKQLATCPLHASRRSPILKRLTVSMANLQLRRQFPKGVQRVHTDGGGEFCFADDGSPLHTITAPDTPQHNPFSERANRTIFDPVRVLLEESGLSAKYWEYAAYQVAYVKNRLHNKAVGCSPFEKLMKKKPSLHHVKVFGCAAYVYDESPQSKVHARAKIGIYLGSYDNLVYTVELINTRRIVYSRHVTFDEDSFPAMEFDSSSSSGEDSDSDASIGDAENSEEEVRIRSTAESSSTSVRRSTRQRKQTEHYTPSASVVKYFANNVIAVPITTSDSPSMKEALEKSSLAERELWIDAINSEFEDLKKSKTWIRVNRKNLKDKKPLPTHIVLKIKRDKDGEPIRFKARIVVGGNFQLKGIDFDDVYAPVVEFSIVRLCLIVVSAAPDCARQSAGANWRT